MQIISVAEILELHGDWIKSQDFIDQVSGRLHVTRRHAYNLIKKSVKDGSIRRKEIEDRGVIYGLIKFESNPIKDTMSEPKSLEKKPLMRQVSKNERKKLEARAETYALAKQFPSFKPLADLFKTQEKIEKEFGSE